MKFVLVVVLVALITTSSASILSRSCKCKAVSDTLYIHFDSWDISSCKLCGCDNPAMVNCQESCKTMVQIYASSGCGIYPTGTIVKYKWEGSSCSTGISSDQYTCV